MGGRLLIQDNLHSSRGFDSRLFLRNRLYFQNTSVNCTPVTNSKDLLNFSIIDQQVSMDFHPRHGTVIPVTSDEMQALKKKWETVHISK